ncbi:HAMP domain-containing sensor histidine kinase [Bacillus rubiinfantis]|uniref:HAMP domain-containing sensor histidine kinase n=1 Tax=Bacillus rubiinfantis TaxID=1499680 RepID=UPI000A73D7EF|nr:HAMP domain-containing sensor histidine kinase [Bacillus rubiinfantis]
MKKYSHSITAKLIVFIMMITCFTGAIKAIVDLIVVNDSDAKIIFEDSYFHSMSFVQESEVLVGNLTSLVGTYKNEKHILAGGTISEEELRLIRDGLYSDFMDSKSYNPNLSEEENRERFNKEYAEKIGKEKEKWIKNDLKEYHYLLRTIKEVKEPLYYAAVGSDVYTNSTDAGKEQFKTYPAYMVFDGYKQEIYPKEIVKNRQLNWITEQISGMNPDTKIYLAFTDTFLQTKISEWKELKADATKLFNSFLLFSLGCMLTFFYLVMVSGRRFYKDGELHLHAIDRLYVDVNILLCAGLTGVWVGLAALLNEAGPAALSKWVVLITIPISAAAFVLILSIVRHMKNRTFFRHTLISLLIHGIVVFIRNVYDSGSVGVKTILIVIGYPLLVAATFFMFPITIAAAAWFTLKKVKAFNAIKAGVRRIKAGDITHSIDVDEKGEFAGLAADINSITDGLKKAVESELKSERLKSELITNVSHDIRTPLTSIITYVDLLKRENDPSKVQEYIEVLEQKSKRLKILTDDLFEAAKASSGNIPVHLERIDLVSLLTQGLGEVSESIEESGLEFKLNHSMEKVYIAADGQLFWRSIENVLSNIFKYALKGSRVYIDIEEVGNEVQLTFKNISAYELNISADELMERFKRGDESRASQGSGLGLSIAKSLIENQGGKFMIQIDGDLFKSMIYIPKDTGK